jgi:hypothetical protein
MPVYKVLISLEVTSDWPMEEIEGRIEHLLEHGTIRDSFDAANLDASHFSVENVELLT